MRQKKCLVTILTVATLMMLHSVVVPSCWSKSYSPNVHWTFCIDTSGSMKQKGHMDLLKLITHKITDEFLVPSKGIVKPGDRISIFSFDEGVRLEVTALYQTDNDMATIKDRLNQMNKRSGSLTFVSEAIVRAVNFTEKYSKFFQTNSLYVFTDGKSEPYSVKWPKEKIEARKRKEAENLTKISILGQNNELNVWLGVLKWEAYEDARSLVEKMGKGAHLVDLTDFNRLSLEKALTNFAETVRSSVSLPRVKSLDLGIIPYKSRGSYQKSISLNIQTDKAGHPPLIMGRINLDPDNPSEITKVQPMKIKSTEDKMVLNFELPESNTLEPGTYKGRLDLYPSPTQFGTLDINPAQFDIKFKKSGHLSFYFLRGVIPAVLGLVVLLFMINKIKRRMPIRV